MLNRKYAQLIEAARRELADLNVIIDDKISNPEHLVIRKYIRFADGTTGIIPQST